MIAERTLKSSDGKRVSLIVHAPTREPWTPEEWACPIGIRIGRQAPRIVVTGRGVDALQALLVALGAARKKLGDEANGLVWLGEPGALGLPMVLLDDDSDFLNIVEALVEAEYARRAFNLKRPMRRSHLH